MSLRGFDQLVGELRRTLAGLPDKRTGSNTQYSMETIGLSAFAVLFTQCPSFLAHQKAMEQRKGQSNALSRRTQITLSHYPHCLSDIISPSYPSPRPPSTAY